MRKAFIIFCWFTCIACWSQSNDSIAIQRLCDKAYGIFLYSPDSAIALVSDAISKAEKADLKFMTGYCNYVFSKANWAKANYLLSIHYGFEALKIYENSNDILHWGKCELSIARTFIDLRNLDQARSYIKKAHHLALQNQNQILLAEVLRERSMFFQETNLYDSALLDCNAGISLFQNQNDTINMSILYGRIARIYLRQKEYKKSARYNTKAILMDSISGNRRALGISYCIAGEIYYGLNKKDSALIFFKKSVAVDQTFRNLTNMIRTRQFMAQIYEDRGEINKSITQLKSVNQLKDSLYDRERNGQIQEMLAQYELTSKENIINQLKREKELEKQNAHNQKLVTIFFGIALLLFALLSFQFWRMRQYQVRANDLKSKLFSVISHDLRGPISNLQSLLDLLTKEYITPDEFKDVSIKLKSSLNVSQNTLENLLNWSLSQMEGIRTIKTSFRISNVISEVIQLIEETASRKKISIDYKKDDSISVNADVNQVNLILRNILHNAIKFSTQNSSVTVETVAQEGFCLIKICDTGMGMTQEEITMVLTSNEYFTKSGTEREKGTGLGFHLCKDFIKRNGGTISVKSETGKGTCVSFTLPLA